MLIGLICAIGLCVLCAGACLVCAGRLLQRADMVKHDADEAKTIAGQAQAASSTAVTLAQALQTKHYDSLAASVASQAGRIATCETQVDSFLESLRNLGNKFEARDRTDRKSRKQADAEAAADAEALAAAQSAPDSNFKNTSESDLPVWARPSFGRNAI